MDIVINDESLDGQFKTIEEFADSVYERTIPMMKAIEENGLCLLKSQQTYERRITKEKTLYDLCMISNFPEIQMLKKTLLGIICDEPFWENEEKTEHNANYRCEFMKQGIPNCITEAYERNGMLLSFQHENFEESVVKIYKNGEEGKVKNASTKEMCAEHLFNLGYIDIIKFLLCMNFSRSICFYSENGKCYAKEALCENNLNISDWKNICEDLRYMFQTIEKGEISRFSKDISDDSVRLYEFRTTISDKREFRLFYIYKDNQICFLNGCVKKEQKTPKVDLALAKKLAKKIN